MAQANVKLTVDASQATRALNGVQAQTTGLQNNLGRLKAAFAGIITSAEYGATLGEVQVINVSFITTGAITSAI